MNYKDYRRFIHIVPLLAMGIAKILENLLLLPIPVWPDCPDSVDVFTKNPKTYTSVNSIYFINADILL
jgi:hypothetical protein